MFFGGPFCTLLACSPASSSCVCRNSKGTSRVPVGVLCHLSSRLGWCVEETVECLVDEALTDREDAKEPDSLRTGISRHGDKNCSV
jgi:hypothetical protein